MPLAPGTTMTVGCTGAGAATAASCCGANEGCAMLTTAVAEAVMGPPLL